MDRIRGLIVDYRRALIIAVHFALWAVSLVFATALRFEFAIPPVYAWILPKLLGVTLFTRTVACWYLGVFHGLWRYSGSRDLRSLAQATTVSSIASAAVWGLLGPQLSHNTFPRSVFVLEWAFSILIVGGLRFMIRTLREISIQNTMPVIEGARRRVLVIGAGDAGEMLMREITRIYTRRYEPVGFLDDNARKHGDRIHGVPVLGPIAMVGDVVKSERVDEIILAIPSLNGREMRKLFDIVRPTSAHIRTLPGMDGVIDGRVTVSQLADVNIEDLLGREPVVLDTPAIAQFLQGAVVMVTGAGGSIGAELCRQACKFGPRKLVLVEQAENGLFHAERQLRADFPQVDIVACVADICDATRMEAIFADQKPGVVLHAAAHKHVPLMEANPGEAIKNNVVGTRMLADLSDKAGVERFVMVSTDKAVNPTSIMGVSKRVAEIYVQALSQRSRTHFITVRFGNVLGSAGSVVPLFREQIAKGGPVTVTHPEMKRYFMTIPEACQLVLQAGAMGKGGDILVLDMGEPVKIVDLARDLIRLSGFDVDRDIEIKFTGMRPGEKLFEEIAVDAEHVERTKHAKIYVGRLRPYPFEQVEKAVASLERVADGTDLPTIKRAFLEIVPEYRGLASAAGKDDTGSVPRTRRSSDASLN